MKRATREWLRAHVTHGNGEPVDAQDILDSDARQRAEIRDLRARLAAAYAEAIQIGWEVGALDRVAKAADLKNKNWRKP